MPPEQLPPSPPGPDFSSADLQRATITPEEAGRILLQYIQQGQQADPTALLAALLKTVTRASSRYIVYPISMSATTGRQQLLPENPLRNALVLNIHKAVDSVGPPRYGFVFEPGPLAFEAMGDSDAIATLSRSLQMTTIPDTINGEQVGGFRIVDFIHPPINAVTLVNRSGNSLLGVVLEGI